MELSDRLSSCRYRQHLSSSPSKPIAMIPQPMIHSSNLLPTPTTRRSPIASTSSLARPTDPSAGPTLLRLRLAILTPTIASIRSLPSISGTLAMSSHGDGDLSCTRAQPQSRVSTSSSLATMARLIRHTSSSTALFGLRTLASQSRHHRDLLARGRGRACDAMVR